MKTYRNLLSLLTLAILTMIFCLNIHANELETFDGYTVDDIINMIRNDEVSGYQRVYQPNNGPTTQSWDMQSFRNELEILSQNSLRSPVHDFTVTTIAHSGRPDDQSIVVVLVGDGFTEQQQGQMPNPASGTFLHCALGVSETLATMYPFSLFSSLFTIYAVQVISTEAGIAVGTEQNPINRPFSGTYFGTYLSQPWTIEGTNTARALQIARDVSAHVIMTQVIANTLEPGGVVWGAGAGYDNINIVGVSTRVISVQGFTWNRPAFHSIFIHEIGHAFGRLTDEHSTGTINLERANIARLSQSHFTDQKWDHWLITNLITRRTEEAPAGYVFPSFNETCKMQGWQTSFCKVCSAELTRRMALISGETFLSGRRPDGTLRPTPSEVTITIPNINAPQIKNRLLPYAFHGNTQIQHLFIPSTITTIGEYAFIGATDLQSITNLSTTPQIINADVVFAGIDRSNITLHTYPGTAQAYLNAGWNGFIINDTSFRFDLTTDSITGPDCIMVNQPVKYTVKVTNIGSEPISRRDYTVNLMNGNTQLASMLGVPLTPNSSFDFQFQWTPTSIGSYNLLGVVDFINDNNPENNATTNNISLKVVNSNVVYVGAGYSSMPNYFDDLQTAINHCPQGGTVYVAGGYGTASEQLDSGHWTGFTLANKDISIIGSSDIDNPSVIGGYFDFTNVTEKTKIENLVFNFYERHMTYTPREQIILLTNANPTLNNLTFTNEFVSSYQNSQIIIRSLFNADSKLTIHEINNSSFNYGNGIVINNNPYGNVLHVNNCHFINGSIDFSGSGLIVNKSSFTGGTINSVGNIVDISNSTFDYQTYHQPSIWVPLISVLDISANSEVRIYNNIFNMTASSNHNRMPRSINVSCGNQITIERNVFKSSGTLNTSLISLDGRTKIIINENDTVPLVGVPHARLINNTDFASENFPPYRFLRHTTNVDIKNSIITGSIVNNNMSSNTSKISYSWFVNPLNNPNYPTNLFNLSGDLEIDTASLRPLWTDTIKSALIDGGDPNTNDAGSTWHIDSNDRDPDGTRPDIGAVHYPHWIIRHGLRDKTILDLVVEKDDYVLPKQSNNNIFWVAFPYLDMLYNCPEQARASYVLGPHNDNWLIHQDPLVSSHFEQIEYNYNEDQDHITNTYNIDHILNSRYGYKIQMKKNNSHKGYILTSGFKYGSTGNPRQTIQILPGENGSTREILLGYFNPPEEIFYALKEIVQYLTEIKTQHWSFNRESTNHPWIVSDRVYTFRTGEAVSLTFAHDQAKTFRWRFVGDLLNDWEIAPGGGGEITMGMTPPEPTHFVDFEEQMDYVPIFVELPEEMEGDDDAELAIFINDICYGAEVVYGTMVQINAYILDIEDDDPEIEFRYFKYNSRSLEQSINRYSVYDQATNSFQERKINLNERKKFYKVSFLAHDEGDPEIPLPEKTSLVGNYPNPFNPNTTIRFNLAQQENVRLTIYNVRGQIVKTLVNGELEAGEHSVIWNGDNDSANNVASGIYFYRFETSVGTEIKRMLLMK